MRRIGVLMSTAETDMQTTDGVTAFVRGLVERGWTLGGRMQIEYRWAEGQSQRYAEIAAEFARVFGRRHHVHTGVNVTGVDPRVTILEWRPRSIQVSLDQKVSK